MSTPLLRRREGMVGMEALCEFDAILDARSPGEYQADHVPGAVSLPVLNDDERVRVGSLHKQESAFVAKKVGAALISRNIAMHLETHCSPQPQDWRPLVYCWRGGNRSGALTTVLRAIGWRAAQLEGGYKAYRHHVVAQLRSLPAQLDFHVICGPTGVGKSRLLRALREIGAQVLDLEELAAHMGSVLGAYPERAQPTQKMFETRVWHQLRGFDPRQPVFVESESRKIGALQTPESLLERMRASPCVNLEADLATRVAVLRREYAHYLADPHALGRQLNFLVELRGRRRIESWKTLAQAGRWDELVAELLEQHYDPAYQRSLGHHFAAALDAETLRPASADETAYMALARQLLTRPREPA